MRKPKSIAKLKKEVWDIFSQFIRMRDCLKTTGDINYGRCVTCGALKHRKDCHAGHFISRSFNATLFDEKNVHCQCARCNLFLGGEPLKYRREIVRLYGEGYDIELEEKAMTTKKFTREELEGLKKHYQNKVKEME